MNFDSIDFKLILGKVKFFQHDRMCIYTDIHNYVTGGHVLCPPPANKVTLLKQEHACLYISLGKVITLLEWADEH